ncbi:hypothetical protein ACS0PU_009671 [Formica fusca]
MPKIKKFKELSRRQQNHRLLLAAQNDNISINISSPKRLVTNKQASSYIECSLENQNCSTIQLFPEVEIQNIQSDDMESDNNIEDSNLLYNNRDERKGTLHEQLHTWATKYNITQKSLTALLCILQKEDHNDLPSDARTLLGRERCTWTQYNWTRYKWTRCKWTRNFAHGSIGHSAFGHNNFGHSSFWTQKKINLDTVQ